MNYVRLILAIIGAVTCGIIHNWLAMIWAIGCVVLCIELIQRRK